MSILEKIEIIENHVPTDGVKFENISSGGFSIKRTHKCGCFIVEHHHQQRQQISALTLEMESDVTFFNRRYFVELCDEHKTLINS